MQERRKHARIEDRLVVQCRWPDGTLMEAIGTLRDISLGGLQFSIASKLVKGDLLGLSIWILNDAIPLRSEGKVVWTKQEVSFDPRSGLEEARYIVGVEFTQFDEIQQERLAAYLKRKTA